MSVSKRSRNRVVSSTQRSSPYIAFSIESSMFDSRISFVIECELRHRVDTRPVRVEMDTMVERFNDDEDNGLLLVP